MSKKIVRCFDVWKDEENNNTWDGRKFTQEEAQKAADSLINCSNCINCSSCQNCAYCSNCSGCDSCERCIDCKGCEHCSYCMACTDCIECTLCKACDAAVNCVKANDQLGSMLSTQEEADMLKDLSRDCPTIP